MEKLGEWQFIAEDYSTIVCFCSQCGSITQMPKMGKEAHEIKRYCNCGAKMEKTSYTTTNRSEVADVDEFICSNCGIHLRDWCRVRQDDAEEDEYLQEYVFKYCPECGKYIVQNKDAEI